jgi:hypothetical protein
MNPPDANNSPPVPMMDAKSAPVVGPEVQRIVSSDVFVSRVEGPLTPEQRIERIEAILKFIGLPPLEEVNRMEAEANAAANKDAAKPRR